MTIEGLVLCILVILLLTGGLSTIWLTSVAIKVIVALLLVAVIIAVVRLVSRAP